MAPRGSTKNHRQQLAKLDDFIRNAMKRWNVPGVAVGIVEGQRTIFARGFGHKDIRRQLPVTPETCFAIGSCTKAFTATTMGILVDESKLDWNTPVRQYVPQFRLHDPIATQQITPRDLLCHCSGLPRHDMVWVGTPCKRQEIFRRLRHIEPSQPFRRIYQYNNLMFMAAGMVVERVAGCGWEEFVRQRICEPLDMASVTFSNVDLAGQPDHAIGYDRRGKRLVRVPHENVVPVGPAGSMNMHIEDLCRWIALQLGKGKVGRDRVITEKNLRTIHTPQVTFQEELSYPELLDPSYALGWCVQPYRGHRRLTHGGCVDGFNAVVAFLPDARIGVAVLTNVTSSPLTRVIPYRIYDHLLGFDPIDWHTRFRREEAHKKLLARRQSRRSKHAGKPTHALCAYAGCYENPGYGELRIVLEDHRLQCGYNGVTRPLDHLHDDQFELVSRGTWPWRKKIVFQVGDHGTIASLAAVLQEGVGEIVFKRVTDRPARSCSGRSAWRSGRKC